MTDVELLSARLEQVVARLEQMAGPEVTPQTYSIPPAHVAAGELIESAWGNSVVDTFALYATHTSHNAGVTNAGGLLINTRIQTLTTNASGDASAGFAFPFATPPAVVACGAEPLLPYLFTTRGITTSTVTWSVRTLENTLVANGSCSVIYIAIGQRV